MAHTYSLKNTLNGWLVCLVIAISPPLESAPRLTGLNILPANEGDILQISYEGDIKALSMSVAREKRAVLTLSHATLNPMFKPKKYKGKLIKQLELARTQSGDITISIDFKRRLGRHLRKQLDTNGNKIIQIELLDETAEPSPKPSDQSVIQPTIERGTFELAGSKEKKSLDYNKDDRKKITTEEFLALFGSRIKPRPNRITDVTYKLTHESLKLVLAMRYKPEYKLSSQPNPAMLKFTLNKTLGDFEIHHALVQNDFIGNIISTRTSDNTLEMRADLYETTAINSKVIKNPDKPGYLLMINVKRIYPWETEAAIPDIDIR